MDGMKSKTLSIWFKELSFLVEWWINFELEHGSCPSVEDEDLVNVPQLSTAVEDCKNIVLRWLASKLDASRAKEVLRGLSNCNINKGDDKKQMLMDCMISFTFSYGLVAHSLQQCIFTTIKR